MRRRTTAAAMSAFAFALVGRVRCQTGAARARAPAAERFDLARYAKILKRLRRPPAASIPIDAPMSANHHGR